MDAYLHLFALLAFFALLNVFPLGKHCRLVFYIMCALSLIFFAGFRNAGVGDDDLVYVEKFLEVPDISYWIFGNYTYSFGGTWMEPAYIFMGACVRYFTGEYLYLFLVVAITSVGLASYNYYKLTHYAFFSLLLFYVHTYLYRDITQIRSAIAAAIGLYLVFSIHHRQHLKSILVILCASMFHMAAFSYIVVFLLSFLRISRHLMIASVVFSLAVGVVGFSYILLDMLPGLGYITEKLYDYADSGYAESVKLFDITNIKNLAVFFVCMFYWHRLTERVPYFKTLMLFYTIAVCWRLVFNDFGIFAARISTFFAVVEVLLIPGFFYIFKNKKLLALVIISYAYLTLYINLFLKEGRHPYIINTLLSI